MRRTLLPSVLMVLCISLLLACAKKPAEPATTEGGPSASGTTAAGGTTGAAAGGMAATGAKPAATGTMAKPSAAESLVVPAGQHIVVRLSQSVGSKISSPGQAFAATVSQPVEINGKVVIPSGAEASGTVAEAVPLGRFKGGARLRLALNTLKVGGTSYNIETASVSEATKG